VTKTPLSDIFDKWHTLTDTHTTACEECNDVFGCDDAALAARDNAWRAMQRFTAQLLSDDAIQEIDAACYADDTVSRKRLCIDPATVELCTRALEDNDPEARWELWCYKWPVNEIYPLT
jgi:hypothetical protein